MSVQHTEPREHRESFCCEFGIFTFEFFSETSVTRLHRIFEKVQVKPFQ